MLKTSLRNVLSHKLRLAMSALAIILGVGFVTGTLIFGDTLKATFANIMTGTVGDVNVTPEDADASSNNWSAPLKTLTGAQVEALATLPGVARVDGNVRDATTFVVGSDGKLVGGQGAPGLAFNWSDGPSASGQPVLTIVDGTAPQGAGELALDRHTAERAGYVLGDTVKLVTASPTPQISATLVGTVEFGGGSLAGASIVLFDTPTMQSIYLGGKDEYQDAWVTANDGQDIPTLVKTVQAALPPGWSAEDGEAAGKAGADEVTEQLGFLTNFLLIFAAISLFVGTFLIVNTFSILVAQRSRELALLRALGAKRGQVTRAVLLEAAIVGTLGATLGLALGFLLAIGIRAVFAQIGLDLEGTALQFAPGTAITAYLVGILTTVFAAWLPARRAGAMAPVAAMREDAMVQEGSIRRRVVIGLAILSAGALALGIGLFGTVPNALWYVGIGMAGVLFGAAMTSPLVGYPFLAAAGAIYRRLYGSIGQMAERNTLRNPGRTAATASALMIGMALVTMMSIFGASAKASIDDQLGSTFTADYVVSNAMGIPFSPATTDQLRAATGVAEVNTIRFLGATVDGKDYFAETTDPAAFERVTGATLSSGSSADLGDDGLLLLSTTFTKAALGDQLQVEVAGTTRTMIVRGFYDDLPALQNPPMLMSHEAGSAFHMPEQDSWAYVYLQPQADPTATKAALDKVVDAQPLISLKDRQQFIDEQSGFVDQMLAIVYALLALAVIIAVLGIVNTLALSVIERTREVGLLRAVGLGRRQLRRMVRLEAIAIALLGALIGIGLGFAFGVALQRALVDDGFTKLAIPWWQVAAFVIFAGVVGVLASLWPARQAARKPVLEAIYTL